MVDLPQDARHEMYANIVIEDTLASGELIIHYGDMTKLDAFEDESFDLVWSGQSIEHVPLEAGERMCREAHRVLKRAGSSASIPRTGRSRGFTQPPPVLT